MKGSDNFDLKPEDIANMSPDEINKYFDEVMLQDNNILIAGTTKKACFNYYGGNLACF